MREFKREAEILVTREMELQGERKFPKGKERDNTRQELQEVISIPKEGTEHTDQPSSSKAPTLDRIEPVLESPLPSTSRLPDELSRTTEGSDLKSKDSQEAQEASTLTPVQGQNTASYPSPNMAPALLISDIAGSRADVEVKKPTGDSPNPTSSLSPPDTSITTVAKASVPYEPSDEEKARYYHGLRGPPTLVARTSSTPWKLTQGRWGQSKKLFQCIGKHDLVDRWNVRLRDAIIDALTHSPFHRVDPIRIKERIHDGMILDVSCVVLLVHILPGAMDWNAGLKMAIACRDILREAGVADVECEVLETYPRLHSVSSDINGKIQWDNYDYDDITRYGRLFSSRLSYGISRVDAPTHCGCMGLHLRLSGKDGTFGLTCRHVVFDPDKHIANADEYVYNGDEDKIDVASGWQFQVTTALSGLETVALEQRRDIENMELQLLCYPKLDDDKGESGRHNKKRQWYQDRIAKSRGIIEECSVWKEHLSQIQNLPQRKIGHIYHAAPLALSNDTKGYLADWALIQLDETVSENRVWLGYEYSRWPISADVDENCLDLKGYLTVAEVLNETRSGGLGLEVGQAGVRFGSGHHERPFRLGHVNQIESIKRVCGRTSWELLVVGTCAYPFSEDGDSGSAVFTKMGEVIGLVIGGWESHKPGFDDARRMKVYSEEDRDPSSNLNVEAPLRETYAGHDVSYVSPIAWVMDDIKRATGAQPVIINNPPAHQAGSAELSTPQ